MVTAEFPKFADILTAALSQHHLLGFEITQLELALGSSTTNKTSGSDGIPAELYEILKDDGVKVLHSVYQQIWKTQQ